MRSSSRVFCISTEADGPWTRPYSKHRSREGLTTPTGAVHFSPYQPTTAANYLPMSRSYGDHVNRPATPPLLRICYLDPCARYKNQNFNIQMSVSIRQKLHAKDENTYCNQKR